MSKPITGWPLRKRADKTVKQQGTSSSGYWASEVASCCDLMLEAADVLDIAADRATYGDQAKRPAAMADRLRNKVNES